MRGPRNPMAQHATILLNVAFIGLLVGSQRTVVPLLAAEQFGISSSSVTLSFISGFGAAKALANLLGGRLSDQVGRRGVLLLGWVFALPVPVLLGAAPGWSWVVIANVLLGVNQGLCWTATLAAMDDLTGERWTGTAMGANELVGYLSIALAAWLTGHLATHLGLREAVLVLAGAAAVAGFAAALTVTETREDQPRPGGRLEAWRPSRHDVACAVAGHITKVIDAGIWGLVPLVLARRGMPLSDIGLVAGIYPAVWGGAQGLTGLMSDRTGRRLPITAGMVLQAGGLMSLAADRGLTIAVAAAAVTGLGAALVYPTLLAAVCDGARDGTSGSALGVYRFWRDLGFVVGAVSVGALSDRIGTAFTLVLVGTAALATAGLVRVLLADDIDVRPSTAPMPAPVSRGPAVPREPSTPAGGSDEEADHHQWSDRQHHRDGAPPDG